MVPSSSEEDSSIYDESDADGAGEGDRERGARDVREGSCWSKKVMGPGKFPLDGVSLRASRGRLCSEAGDGEPEEEDVSVLGWINFCLVGCLPLGGGVFVV
jgi:hypothetical protein